MASHKMLKRYRLILEKVGNKQFPSLKEISQYIYDHDLNCSERTVQRDIENIRYEFGVEIEYVPHKSGYTIKEEESIDAEGFIRFLEVAGTADLVLKNLQKGKKALEYIDFEAQGEMLGSEHIEPILAAIEERKKIEFVHENFWKNTRKTHLIAPYLLKEYQKRWYVVGIPEGSEEPRTYGLDRIVKLTTTTKLYTPTKKIDFKHLFDPVVGLIYSMGEPEELRLSVHPNQYNYMRSLPLHPTQEVVSNTDDEVILKYWLIPNFELRQRILMLGSQVKVLQPEWFAQEVKEELKNAWERY